MIKTYECRKLFLFFACLCLLGLILWSVLSALASSSELLYAIQESNISSKDKMLLTKLINDDNARSSELVNTYLDPGAPKRTALNRAYEI